MTASSNPIITIITINNTIKGSRGSGGDIIVLDEAAYIPKKTMFGVIVPTAQVRNVVLVAISTKSDEEDNWFNSLVTYTDLKGNPLINSIRFEHASSKIYTDGTTNDMDFYTKSVFEKSMDPSHKSDEQRQKWDDIYKKAGLSKMNLTENYGVESKDGSAIFDMKTLIDMLCNNVPRTPAGHDMTRGCQKIIVAIDPSYTGENNTAIAIGYRDSATGIKVYLWIDVKLTKTSDEMSSFVVDSVVAFRAKFTALRDKPIIVCTETNSSSAGSYVKERLTRSKDPTYGKVARLEFYKTKDEYGVIKTAQLTKAYIAMTQDMFIYRKLAFAHSIGCCHPKGIDHVMTELFDGAKRFRYENQSKRSCSTGKGRSGENDDILVAFMMVCYFSQIC